MLNRRSLLAALTAPLLAPLAKLLPKPAPRYRNWTARYAPGQFEEMNRLVNSIYRKMKEQQEAHRLLGIPDDGKYHSVYNPGGTDA